MSVKYITAYRVVNGTRVAVDYVAANQPDGYLYFNDDRFWRCKEDGSLMQVYYPETGVWVGTNAMSLNEDAGGGGVSGGNTGGGSVAANADIEKFVQWCIDIANDPAHGYDQGNRNGPDYDCSSLVWWGLHNAGFDVGTYAFNTDLMPSVLSNAGFINIGVPQVGDLQRGDILLRQVPNRDHTEVYIGAQQRVGAHQNEVNGVLGGRPGDQTGNEISILPYNAASGWTSVWRYQGLQP